MSTPRAAGRVVVVGGGLAGYTAADELRRLGHTDPIVVIDSEPALYDRPPLSKRLFDPDFSVDALSFADADALAARRIDALLGRRAVRLDAIARAVALDDGTILEADTILLAPGGEARRLPVPGVDSPRVFVLRTFADARAIREHADAGSRAVVIGAGLIGAEVASSLRLAGVDTTLVDPAPLPLVPAVGELMAGLLHDMHTENGVRVVRGVTARIEPEGDGVTVVLDDGERLAADLVIVGVGIVPHVELAESAGIDVDNGIIINDRHRTSADGVYAAGDAARLRGADGVLRRREEHWDAAQAAGRGAAHGMLGLEAPARSAPWFWSDRHGVHLEATGRLMGEGQIVVRAGTRHPAVFLVADGVLVGAAAVDDSATVRAARRLIDQRVPITPEALADPAVSLRTLLRAAR